MKILNKVNTEEWTLEVKCDKCDTKMEIEWPDLLSEYLPPDRNESGVTVFYIKCGVCREKVNILSANIPKAVQVEVLDAKAGLRSTSRIGNSSQWDDGGENFFNK